MADEEKEIHIQVNAAKSQRNANRDYHEVRAPQSVGLYLAVTPQAEIDTLTLDNATLFRRRFGFEAAKQMVRAQVLDIRQRYEMTDREIRWLRYSGFLCVTRTEARLIPDRWMLVAGWIQIVFFSILFSGWVLQIGVAELPAWKQMFGQAAIATIWFSAAWGLSKLYIEPWRLLRKVGVLSS